MFSFIILLVLVFGFFMGLKRGFILQVMHLAGYIISFIIASVFYRSFASHLSFWIPYPELSDESLWAIFLNSAPLEQAFYNGIAFILLFIIAKIVLQIIASMLDFIARIPVLKQINKLLGAILGFIEVYLIVFIILFILALVPVEFIQTKLKGSFLATLIVEHTPILSSLVKDMWFTDILTIIPI